MSTKTIAVESTVYERLAREKRDSESFTKVIARLLGTAAESHTGRRIASSLSSTHPIDKSEAERMLTVVRENRDGEKWKVNDLR